MRKRDWNKILVGILVVIMIVTSIPVNDVWALDMNEVPSVTSGNAKRAVRATTPTELVTNGQELSSGEYVLKDKIWTNSSKSPLSIKAGANVTINIEGENKLESTKEGYAGIYVPKGASLIVQGSGKLTVTGASLAAGIGGNKNTPCGNITIAMEQESSKLEVYGGSWSAAIGDGDSVNGNTSAEFYSGDSYIIRIDSGNVYAKAGTAAAAIGTTDELTMGTASTRSVMKIVLNGGTITAIGGEKGPYNDNCGAGIGAGTATKMQDKSICIKEGTTILTDITAMAQFGKAISTDQTTATPNDPVLADGSDAYIIIGNRTKVDNKVELTISKNNSEYSKVFEMPANYISYAATVPGKGIYTVQGGGVTDSFVVNTPGVSSNTQNILYYVDILPDGSTKIESDNVIHGGNSQVTIAENPFNFTRQGYSLVGWSLSPDGIDESGNPQIYKSGDKITMNFQVMLYAQWQKSVQSSEGITGVPNETVTGDNLTLTGTVHPSDATKKDITWSVKDAGTTGATIENGSAVLQTTAAGTVIVTATIKDGLVQELEPGKITISDYTQDFTILVKEPKPVSKINYEKEQLQGFVPEKPYTITVGDIKTEVTSDKTGAIAIKEEWIGKEITVIKKNSNSQLDSEAQAIQIPARPSAPTPQTGNETIYGKKDGSITNLSNAMEYKKDEENRYTACESDHLNNLESGSYDIRISATETSFASKKVTVTVQPGAKLEVTYNANGAVGTVPEKESYGYNDTVTILNGTTLTKEGYSFDGWNTKEDGKGKSYASGDQMQITGQVTLYAQWKIHTYQVTLPVDVEGVTVSADTESSNPVEYGGSYTFHLAVADGYDDTAMIVKVNDTTVTPIDGSYCIENIKDNCIVTVEGVTDSTSPTGTIQVGETANNKWDNFLSNIAFDLFFNQSQTVTITAEDQGSGMATIEYTIYEKTEEKPYLSREEVQGFAHWTRYNEAISLLPNHEYVVYAKLVDKKGNVTYLSSDGLVFDNVKPVISGVVSDETYIGTTEVTITDKYDMSVTVNGEPQEVTDNKFSLVPSTTPCTICVTDQAGNVTELTNVKIDWKNVDIPSVESKEYNGLLQKAELADTQDYTVTVNEGGISANEYTVSVTLKDPVNAKWSGTTEATIDLVFPIVRAKNEFVTELTCPDVLFGESIQPNAETKYGEVIYKYADSEDGEYTTSVPTIPGTYYVKAVVEETSDYEGLVSGAVKVTIEKPSVDGITGVPDKTVAGENVTLTGTVHPSDATKKDITWSVKDAGTTEATIENGSAVLQTTAAGTVIVTATIKDGLVQKLESGKITTSDYTKDFTILVKEPKPVVSVNYEKEQLQGFVPEKPYTITVGDIKTEVTPDETGAIAINEEWIGKEITVIKKNSNSQLDSEAQAIQIPARPSAPTPQTENETIYGKKDGSITNLSNAMEYKKQEENRYTACESDRLNNVESGSYEIRIGATETSFASEKVTVTVQPGVKLEVTYSANGAVGTVPEKESYGYNAMVTILDGTTLAKEGYSFVGWNTKEDGKGKPYASGDQMQITGQVTLYAQWKINTYQVTLPVDVEGVTVSADELSSNPVEYGGSYTFHIAVADGYDDTAMVVKVNDTIVTPIAGTYCIENIKEHCIVTVEGVVDSLSPTGTIEVGKNTNHKWDSFLSNIAFALFFNQSQTVTITAEDQGSGMATIEYTIYEKTEDKPYLSKEEVQGFAHWTRYNEAINLLPNHEYVVYAKLVDKKGNVTYLSSDGLVFDNVKPVISGVVSNETYIGTTELTIADKYNMSVTVNGVAQEVTDHKFSLVPFTTPYTICVTDQAGNVTELTNVIIDWKNVEIPSIESKEYNGLLQKAELVDTQDYTVTVNEGGISANEYTVRVTLKDPVNAKWSGTTEATIDLVFPIVQAKNEFVTELTCQNVLYGESIQPSAEAKYGEVSYKYADSEDGEYTTSVPTIPGTYYVKAVVEETSDYEGLVSGAIKVTIEKLQITGINIVPYEGMYDGTKHDSISNITGTQESDFLEYYIQNDDGDWTQWIGEGVPQFEQAGNHQVKVVIKRENYEDYETMITTKIKVASTVAIKTPIYDSDDATKVTVEGNIIKGDYDIVYQNFQYRKEGTDVWTKIDTINQGVQLVDLEEDTVYELEILVTDTEGNTDSKKVKFRTLSKSEETGKIVGTIAGEQGKEYSVTLQSGNTIVSSITGLKDGNRFSFDKLPNGEYNLVTTDGLYTITHMATVEDGTTVEFGVIEIGLKQTVVEVQKDAPNVAVEGLNELFSTEFWENSNSQAIIEQGGNAEIKLIADIAKDTEIKGKITEKGELDNKVIGLFTDLTVKMIVTTKEGRINETNLANTEKLVLIAIPLPKEAQGKEEYRMYRSHEGQIQELGYIVNREENQSEEGFYVKGEYAYVYANSFSTYALAYNKEVISPPEETKKPEATVAPEETKKPEATVAPEETKKPEVTVPPEETKKPEATVAPVAPEETKKPDKTVAPAKTEKPKSTSTPKQTKKPDTTKSPNKTSAPIVTQGPTATKRPGTATTLASSQSTDSTSGITETAQEEISENTEEDTKVEKESESSTEEETIDKETGEENEEQDKNSTGAIDTSSNKDEESCTCFWHWFIILALVIYAILILFSKKTSWKYRMLLSIAEVIVALIIAILGCCHWDWWFFIGNLIIVAIIAIGKRYLIKQKEERE